MNITSIDTYRIDMFSPMKFKQKQDEHIVKLLQDIKDNKKRVVSVIDTMGASSYLITFIFDKKINEQIVNKILKHDSILSSVAYEIQNMYTHKQKEAIIQAALIDLNRCDPMHKKLLLDKVAVVDNKKVEYKVIINKLPQIHDVFGHKCMELMKETLENHIFETLFDNNEQQHTHLARSYTVEYMQQLLQETHKPHLQNIVIVNTILEFQLQEAQLFMFYGHKEDSLTYSLNLLTDRQIKLSHNKEAQEYKHLYYNDNLEYNVSTTISTESTTYSVHIASTEDADEETIKSMLNILVTILTVQDIITNTFINLYNCAYVCVLDTKRQQKYALYISPIYSNYSKLYITRANALLQQQYDTAINKNRR